MKRTKFIASMAALAVLASAFAFVFLRDDTGEIVERCATNQSAYAAGFAAGVACEEPMYPGAIDPRAEHSTAHDAWIAGWRDGSAFTARIAAISNP